MSKRWSIAAALLAGLAIGSVGCGGGVTEVRLGAILSLTGMTASSAEDIRHGIEVAVDFVNEGQGGVLVDETSTRVPLVIEFRDSGGSAQTGAEAARELIEMGVPAIIGAITSDVTLAIAPIAMEAGIVLLSPASSSPKLSTAGPLIYRNYPSDELEAVNTADHIYNRAGIHEVAIVSSQSEYGMGIMGAFIQRFRALGGSVEMRETFPAGTTEFGAIVDHVDAAEVDGIYIAGYTTEIAAMARALRAAGVEAQLYASGSVVEADLIAEGGEAVDGLVFPKTVFDPTADAERVQQFVEGYEARFGELPNTYAAHGYDAVLILVQAIEQAGMRPNDISFYMNTMDPFEGAAGLTKFDDSGNVRKFHRMFVIRGSEAVPVDQGNEDDGAES